MAHFAEIENGIVKQVIVVSNQDLLKDGVEDEQTGIDFCKKLLGVDTEWVQTSYNGNNRHKYAGIGDTYDAINEVFIAPQPYASWDLDDNFDWQPPIAMPDDGFYRWNEDELEWEEVKGMEE